MRVKLVAAKLFLNKVFLFYTIRAIIIIRSGTENFPIKKQEEIIKKIFSKNNVKQHKDTKEK